MGRDSSHMVKKVIINKTYCKECGYCRKFCPDKALRYSKAFNDRGYHPVKWKGDCSFCGICYTVCPEAAIQVKENEEALER